ncbi:hypothetical protein FB389_0828 [Rarobacter incanus]|uniref:Uncharacterized protein n=1 Tax=Rarobacter incanus TaxID=153494 RepID=A0A542SNH3_9MICO|nr:hypothetical protein FB389_0828 [Rarobacter incanus]
MGFKAATLSVEGDAYPGATVTLKGAGWVNKASTAGSKIAIKLAKDANANPQSEFFAPNPFTTIQASENGTFSQAITLPKEGVVAGSVIGIRALSGSLADDDVNRSVVTAVTVVATPTNPSDPTDPTDPTDPSNPSQPTNPSGTGSNAGTSGSKAKAPTKKALKKAVKKALKGKAKVGKKVTVKLSGKKFAKNAKVTVRWVVGKKAVKGKKGTNKTYKVRKSNVGKALRVRVTVKVPGVKKVTTTVLVEKRIR